MQEKLVIQTKFAHNGLRGNCSLYFYLFNLKINAMALPSGGQPRTGAEAGLGADTSTHPPQLGEFNFNTIDEVTPFDPLNEARNADDLGNINIEDCAGKPIFLRTSDATKTTELEKAVKEKKFIPLLQSLEKYNDDISDPHPYITIISKQVKPSSRRISLTDQDIDTVKDDEDFIFNYDFDYLLTAYQKSINTEEQDNSLAELRLAKYILDYDFDLPSQLKALASIKQTAQHLTEIGAGSSQQEIVLHNYYRIVAEQADKALQKKFQEYTEAKATEAAKEEARLATLDNLAAKPAKDALIELVNNAEGSPQETTQWTNFDEVPSFDLANPEELNIPDTEVDDQTAQIINEKYKGTGVPLKVKNDQLSQLVGYLRSQGSAYRIIEGDKDSVNITLIIGNTQDPSSSLKNKFDELNTLYTTDFEQTDAETAIYQRDFKYNIAGIQNEQQKKIYLNRFYHIGSILHHIEDGFFTREAELMALKSLHQLATEITVQKDNIHMATYYAKIAEYAKTVLENRLEEQPQEAEISPSVMRSGEKKEENKVVSEQESTSLPLTKRFDDLAATNFELDDEIPEEAKKVGKALLEHQDKIIRNAIVDSTHTYNLTSEEIPEEIIQWIKSEENAAAIEFITTTTGMEVKTAFVNGSEVIQLSLTEEPDLNAEQEEWDDWVSTSMDYYHTDDPFTTSTLKWFSNPNMRNYIAIHDEAVVSTAQEVDEEIDRMIEANEADNPKRALEIIQSKLSNPKLEVSGVLFEVKTSTVTLPNGNLKELHFIVAKKEVPSLPEKKVIQITRRMQDPADELNKNKDNVEEETPKALNKFNISYDKVYAETRSSKDSSYVHTLFDYNTTTGTNEPEPTADFDSNVSLTMRHYMDLGYSVELDYDQGDPDNPRDGKIVLEIGLPSEQPPVKASAETMHIKELEGIVVPRDSIGQNEAKVYTRLRRNYDVHAHNLALDGKTGVNYTSDIDAGTKSSLRVQTGCTAEYRKGTSITNYLDQVQLTAEQIELDTEQQEWRERIQSQVYESLIVIESSLNKTIAYNTADSDFLEYMAKFGEAVVVASNSKLLENNADRNEIKERNEAIVENYNRVFAEQGITGIEFELREKKLDNYSPVSYYIVAIKKELKEPEPVEGIVATIPSAPVPPVSPAPSTPPSAPADAAQPGESMKIDKFEDDDGDDDDSNAFLTRLTRPDDTQPSSQRATGLYTAQGGNPPLPTPATRQTTEAVTPPPSSAPAPQPSAPPIFRTERAGRASSPPPPPSRGGEALPPYGGAPGEPPEPPEGPPRLEGITPPEGAKGDRINELLRVDEAQITTDLLFSATQGNDQLLSTIGYYLSIPNTLSFEKWREIQQQINQYGKWPEPTAEYISKMPVLAQERLKELTGGWLRRPGQRKGFGTLFETDTELVIKQPIERALYNLSTAKNGIYRSNSDDEAKLLSDWGFNVETLPVPMQRPIAGLHEPQIDHFELKLSPNWENKNRGKLVKYADVPDTYRSAIDRNGIIDTGELLRQHVLRKIHNTLLPVYQGDRVEDLAFTPAEFEAANNKQTIQDFAKQYGVNVKLKAPESGNENEPAWKIEVTDLAMPAMPYSIEYSNSLRSDGYILINQPIIGKPILTMMRGGERVPMLGERVQGRVLWMADTRSPATAIASLYTIPDRDRRAQILEMAQKNEFSQLPATLTGLTDHLKAQDALPRIINTEVGIIMEGSFKSLIDSYRELNALSNPVQIIMRNLQPDQLEEKRKALNSTIERSREEIELTLISLAIKAKPPQNPQDLFVSYLAAQSENLGITYDTRGALRTLDEIYQAFPLEIKRATDSIKDLEKAAAPIPEEILNNYNLRPSSLDALGAEIRWQAYYDTRTSPPLSEDPARVIGRIATIEGITTNTRTKRRLEILLEDKESIFLENVVDKHGIPIKTPLAFVRRNPSDDNDNMGYAEVVLAKRYREIQQTRIANIVQDAAHQKAVDAFWDEALEEALAVDRIRLEGLESYKEGQQSKEAEAKARIIPLSTNQLYSEAERVRSLHEPLEFRIPPDINVSIQRYRNMVERAEYLTDDMHHSKEEKERLANILYLIDSLDKRKFDLERQKDPDGPLLAIFIQATEWSDSSDRRMKVVGDELSANAKYHIRNSRVEKEGKRAVKDYKPYTKAPITNSETELYELTLFDHYDIHTDNPLRQKREAEIKANKTLDFVYQGRDGTYYRPSPPHTVEIDMSSQATALFNLGLLGDNPKTQITQELTDPDSFYTRLMGVKQPPPLGTSIVQAIQRQRDYESKFEKPGSQPFAETFAPELTRPQEREGRFKEIDVIINTNYEDLLGIKIEDDTDGKLDTRGDQIGFGILSDIVRNRIIALGVDNPQQLLEDYLYNLEKRHVSTLSSERKETIEGVTNLLSSNPEWLTQLHGKLAPSEVEKLIVLDKAYSDAIDRFKYALGPDVPDSMTAQLPSAISAAQMWEETVNKLYEEYSQKGVGPVARFSGTRLVTEPLKPFINETLGIDKATTITLTTINAIVSPIKVYKDMLIPATPADIKRDIIDGNQLSATDIAILINLRWDELYTQRKTLLLLDAFTTQARAEIARLNTDEREAWEERQDSGPVHPPLNIISQSARTVLKNNPITTESLQLSDNLARAMVDRSSILGQITLQQEDLERTAMLLAHHPGQYSVRERINSYPQDPQDPNIRILGGLIKDNVTNEGLAQPFRTFQSLDEEQIADEIRVLAKYNYPEEAGIIEDFEILGADGVEGGIVAYRNAEDRIRNDGLSILNKVIAVYFPEPDEATERLLEQLESEFATPQMARTKFVQRVNSINFNADPAAVEQAINETCDVLLANQVEGDVDDPDVIRILGLGGRHISGMSERLTDPTLTLDEVRTRVNSNLQENIPGLTLDDDMLHGAIVEAIRNNLQRRNMAAVNNLIRLLTSSDYTQEAEESRSFTNITKDKALSDLKETIERTEPVSGGEILAEPEIENVTRIQPIGAIYKPPENAIAKKEFDRVVGLGTNIISGMSTLLDDPDIGEDEVIRRLENNLNIRDIPIDQLNAMLLANINSLLKRTIDPNMSASLRNALRARANKLFGMIR